DGGGDCGDERGGWRVMESCIRDRIDRKVGNIFGFSGNTRRKSFSTAAGGGGGWPVGAEDRVDRETRNLFGFVRKIPPEKFSGGGRVVVAGGGPVVGGWGEVISTRMYRDLSLRTSGPK
nr:hypothetical protein [Tanacetum cinerariifolium]